ncbi:MAG: TniQ family protein, partial [Cyclobacteriaceae bacterium]
MFRTAYINQPYFRESYFSILNRYKDHLGLNGFNASRHLFGEVIRRFNPNQALNVDLFIKRICQNSFLNNANTIIENHTLIPYLRPFVSQSELNQIIQLMKGSFINPPLIKTLSTPQKALRYCPICVKSDRVK